MPSNHSLRGRPQARSRVFLLAAALSLTAGGWTALSLPADSYAMPLQQSLGSVSTGADTSVSPAVGSPAPDAMAVLFTEKCSSCHSIGSGDKTGPDLKGVTARRSTDWLRRFVKTPRDLYRAGDETAALLFGKFVPNVMPDQPLSDDEVDRLMAFIAEVTASGRPFVPVGGGLPRALAPGDTTAGRAYFTGGRSLSAGAPSCISCHTTSELGALGGGTLGPDLTKIAVRFTEPELVNVLRNPALPVMATTFASRPLNDEELVQVYAYLSSVRGREPVDAGAYFTFTAAGMGLALLVLLLLDRAGRERLRGVRRPLVARATRKAREGDTR